MPESRDLPPAGYTRAAPRPPLRSRLFGARAALASRGRSPFPAAVLALVLAAGIVGVIGYGTRREPPARTLRPDAVSPSAPMSAAPGGAATVPGAAAPTSVPPEALPGAGPGAAPGVPAPVPGGPVHAQDGAPGARPGGGASGTAAPPGSSGDAQAGPAHARPAATVPPHRHPRPRPRPRPAPRPHVPSGPRTARPAAPSWIGPECRRRFPGDPARQGACVAALTRYYAK